MTNQLSYIDSKRRGIQFTGCTTRREEGLYWLQYIYGTELAFNSLQVEIFNYEMSH